MNIAKFNSLRQAVLVDWLHKNFDADSVQKFRKGTLEDYRQLMPLEIFMEKQLDLIEAIAREAGILDKMRNDTDILVNAVSQMTERLEEIEKLLPLAAHALKSVRNSTDIANASELFKKVGLL